MPAPVVGGGAQVGRKLKSLMRRNVCCSANQSSKKEKRKSEKERGKMYVSETGRGEGIREYKRKTGHIGSKHFALMKVDIHCMIVIQSSKLYWWQKQLYYKLL